MRFSAATLSVLVERGLPVVAEYDLFKIIYDLSVSRTFRGRAFRGRASPATREKYRRIVSELLSARYLRPDPDFSGAGEEIWAHPTSSYTRVFRVSDVADGSAEDVACLVDPFCYLSHFSAMQRYGLTNRIPDALSLSSPARWTEVRDAQLQEDYPDLEEGAYIAPLVRIQFPGIIRRRPIVLHKTRRTPSIRRVRGAFTRIASVGEVFVQTLDRPELCGGMPHVFDVWMEYGATYAEEIIQATNDSEESIIKVRAGYLLDEVLKIKDPRIEQWTQFAQRGGSRKLDPAKPYISTFSEKWMLSLNVQRSGGSL